jgi:tetratricopeptide (TPR) repeat protein
MRPDHCARLVGALLLLPLLTVGTGCEDVHARKLVKEGNDLYRQGEYKAAVQKYDEAARIRPQLAVTYINRAYAYLLQFAPGSNSPENTAAANGAIESYKKFLELQPQRKDVRDLLIQLWLDSGHFDEALAYFKGLLDHNPKNLEAVKTIGIINAKAGRFQEALSWYEKRAALEPSNPEGAYAVGTLCWERLFHHRPPDQPGMPPSPDAILGPQRLALADHGIHALEKAVSLNDKYIEAYTYTNLMYRERALGHLNASVDPAAAAQVQEDIKKADEFQKKALELIREQQKQEKEKGQTTQAKQGK